MICANYFPTNIVVNNTEFVSEQNLKNNFEKEMATTDSYYCETNNCGILDFFGFINNELYLYLYNSI